MLSHVTPWTAARQAPLSMDFSRQEYWSGVLEVAISFSMWSIFELIFMYVGGMVEVPFFPLHMDSQLFKYHLLKWELQFSIEVFLHLSKIILSIKVYNTFNYDIHEIWFISVQLDELWQIEHPVELLLETRSRLGHNQDLQITLHALFQSIPAPKLTTVLTSNSMD